VVIPEINALGKISMDISSGKRVVNGRIVSTGSDMREATFKSGSQDLFSGSQEIIRDAIDSFDNLQIIGTKNNWSLEEYFVIDSNRTFFTRNVVGDPSAKVVKNVNDELKPIFTDPTVSSLPAFKYLPPTFPGAFPGQTMAVYRKINEDPCYQYAEVINKLEAETGIPVGASRTTAVQKQTFVLDSDDPYLNILGQVFEINEDSVGKMAMIDYGTYKNPDGSDKGSIYHVGKIFKDNQNIPKFVKVFTLVFE
jgi:hypothetical protein